MYAHTHNCTKIAYAIQNSKFRIQNYFFARSQSCKKREEPRCPGPSLFIKANKDFFSRQTPKSLTT